MSEEKYLLTMSEYEEILHEAKEILDKNLTT